MADQNPWKDVPSRKEVPPSLPPRREEAEEDLPPAYSTASASHIQPQSPHIPSAPQPVTEKPIPTPISPIQTTSTPLQSPPTVQHQPSFSYPKHELARAIPGLNAVNLNAYAPPGAQASPEGGVLTFYDPKLCNSPQALSQWITEQILLPPIPKVRIRGGTMDFDIYLQMLRYFLPEEGQPKLGYAAVSTNPSDGKGKQKSGLPAGSSDPATWARSFCADKSESKVLVINRRLMNWDSDVISGRTHALLSSLNYKGTVSVTFPVKNQRTELKMGEASFITSFKNAFTGKAEKRYEIDVFWPYATHPPGENGDGAGGTLRRCLVRTEEGWFGDWKPVIQEAVLDRRRGKVGLDDMLETATSPPRSNRVPQPWGGPNYSV